MNNSNPAAAPKIDLADYFQRFSTRVLWHFTGYKKTNEKAFEILNAILETKNLRVSEKFTEVLMHDGQKRLGYSIACMCDIPFRDLRIHMLRYGQFGIAFHKRDAIRNGHFNPVFYVHRNNVLFQKAKNLLNAIESEVKPDTSLHKNLQEYFLMIGGYVKRGDLTRIIELDSEVDSTQENNFYYEREWRTLFSWKFEDTSIAAIMMPQSFLTSFRTRWGDRFVASSIVSSEMIETL
jgi:hypothetical protein